MELISTRSGHGSGLSPVLNAARGRALSNRGRGERRDRAARICGAVRAVADLGAKPRRLAAMDGPRPRRPGLGIVRAAVRVVARQAALRDRAMAKLKRRSHAWSRHAGIVWQSLLQSIF